MLEELSRLSLVIAVAFVPLFVFGLYGLFKLKKWDLLLFVVFGLLAAVFIEIRIMLTVEFVLLIGFAEFFRQHRLVGVACCVIVFVLLLGWWVFQKLWLFGVV